MAEHPAVVAAVIEAVAGADPTDVAAALAGLTEPQRRAAWKAVRERRMNTGADAAAVLGTAPGAKSAVDVAWVLELPPDFARAASRVLADRRPPWLEELARRLLDRATGPGWGFSLVRHLIRGGLIAAPPDSSYVLAMVHGLTPWSSSRDGATPYGALVDDPDLLERELWALLGTERAGRALADHDHWRLAPSSVPGRPAPEPQPEATWHHALLRLTREGIVDRARVVDAALHAMLADWAAIDVSWFVELHDGLDVRDDELSDRRDSYLRLLASGIGPVVQRGLRAAGRLLEAGAADAELLGPALAPTLMLPQKGTALAALHLLERAAEAEPAHSAMLADTAALALEHPRADVRDRARRLATTTAIPESSGRDEPTAPESAPDDGLSGRDTPAFVTALADVDALGELLAHLIEEADDPIGVERALDGVLRFPRATPSAAESLAHRAQDRLSELYPGPWTGQELRADIAALTLVWLDRMQPGPGYLGRTVGHDYTNHSATSFTSHDVKRPDWSLPALMTTRIHEVARSVGPGAGQLLSLPTTSDGSLAAATLNERLCGLRSAPPLDLGLAILRVPPHERGTIRLPALLHGSRRAKKGIAALHESAPRWHRVVADTTGLWGHEGPVTMVGWADPESPAGQPDRLVEAALDRRDPLARAGLEANDGEFAGRPDQVTAMWPLMLPHHLDHLAAHAHPRLARALTRNRSGSAPLIVAIARHPDRGHAPTASALVLAMAAKEATVRTAAVDAVILRSRRELIDADSIAEQIRLCLTDDLVVGTRLVDSLAEAARADRATAEAVLDVMTQVLECVPGRRDAHRWIEVLADLTHELQRPVRLPAPLQALVQGPARSVVARACRRVLVES